MNRRIAITGGTGFVGRALLSKLEASGDKINAWYRNAPPADLLSNAAIDWIPGDLNDLESIEPLLQGCDCVVHSAFWRPGKGFRGSEGELTEFVETNVVGTIRLMQAAGKLGAKRFVYVSSGAVHERILDDRPLDEHHPRTPRTHYGAHKAAIEQFIHSYGWGEGWPVCALRPTGIYGTAQPKEDSKWYSLIQQIAEGFDVEVQGGGKEVHVTDVAKAICLLLEADEDSIRGEVFNCYDRYVSQFEVAHLAKQLSGSTIQIYGEEKSPRHQIDTGKIQALGMRFGGTELLEKTIAQLIGQ